MSIVHCQLSIVETRVRQRLPGGWVCTRIGGLTTLLEVKHAPGNPNSIPAEVVSRLKERLKQPQGFSSYGLQQWLEVECGVTAAYHTVHSLVRYKLQARTKKTTPKKPKAKSTGDHTV